MLWVRVTLMRIRIQLFTSIRIRIRLIILMRIRIVLLIKVIRICDHWSRDSSRLHCERPQLLNFNLDAHPDPAVDFDADPAFHSHANADPASKNHADPDPQHRLWAPVQETYARFILSISGIVLRLFLIRLFYFACKISNLRRLVFLYRWRRCIAF